MSITTDVSNLRILLIDSQADLDAIGRRVLSIPGSGSIARACDRLQDAIVELDLALTHELDRTAEEAFA